MTKRKPMQHRLPPDLKDWLQAEAERNGSSQNSEVIRSIRAAMGRASKSQRAMVSFWDGQGKSQMCKPETIAPGSAGYVD